ncbi:MAG TPA: sensor histidine kinase [Chitinophagaceae bacterium]
MARHVAFWVVWCLAFNLLFHFPIHVFKGWDISGPGTKNYQVLGPVLFFIKALIVNSFFGVIIPQIALTYVLIYWLLPNYYFQKRKNTLVVVAISAGLLLMFYFVAVGFKLSAGLYNRIAGIGGGPPMPPRAFLQVVMIDQIGSLPIVLSFALMIKLVKRWWLKQKETELLAKEKTKAELQLLKAQVHPHFLFNTLNNIYFFALTNSAQAPVMIKKLTGLLNYILNECDKSLVPLEKEIKMIRDYMALEKIRYAEQMQMTIDAEGDVDGKLIAPLLLIPLVENSFKHGASKMITQPWIKLNIKIEDKRLHFIIRNSQPTTNKSETAKAGQPNKQGNIGIKNVTKRLGLIYPGIHELNIVSEPESYAVHLSLQLVDIKDHAAISDEIKPLNEYAMA